MFKVGLGIDHHRLAEGKSPEGFSLTLGGFEIPDSGLTLVANSDGDVIIHALCNALSTALGGGSIGPVTDPLCQAGQKESSYYLQHYRDLISDADYAINNISISLEASRPRLEQWRTSIVASLAEKLNIKNELIGLAFTTGEGLTACGQGAGMMAQVLVSLVKNNVAEVKA